MRESVSLFFAMDTQWKWVGAGMAGAFRSGLDYTALTAVASALGLSVTGQHFRDIRLMEAEAISVWNRQR